MSALLALAFGAGLLAPVNPCGFALLPAYLGGFLQEGPCGTAGERLRRALGVGAAVTLGFSATLTAIGVALALGLRALIDIVGWLAVGVGAVLILTGVAMLLGRGITLAVPGGGAAATRMAGWRRMRLVGFGAGYAVASASCTVGILLAVVAQAVATGTLGGAAAVFAAYAAGSAILMLTLAVAAAVANAALATAIGHAARYLPRIAGGLLTASGIYLIAYWTPSLLDNTQAAGSNPLTRLAAATATWISTHQPTVIITAAAVLIAATLAAILTSRRSTPRPPAHCCETGHTPSSSQTRST